MAPTPVPADGVDWSCPISINKLLGPAFFEDDHDSVVSTSGESGFLTDGGIRRLLLRFTDETPNEILDQWFSTWTNTPKEMPSENIALMDPAWLSQWARLSPEERQNLHDTAFPRPFLKPDGTVKELKRIVIPCHVLNTYWLVIAIDTVSRKWILYDSSPSISGQAFCTNLLNRFEETLGIFGPSRTRKVLWHSHC